MSLVQGNKYSEEDWIPPDTIDPGASAKDVDAGATMEAPSSEGGGMDTGEEQTEKKKLLPQLNSALLRKVAIPIAAVLGFVLLILLLKPKGSKTSGEVTPTPGLEDAYDVTQDSTVLGKFQYTVEELAELRVNGYTVDEVETYEALEIPAGSLITDAELKRKELYEREIAPYLDAASDEYKELAADTWVGQTEFQLNDDVAAYRFHTEVWNVDYKKLPSRGNQLFLKLTLEDGRVLFMAVTPEQYLGLSESGNIVVQVRYTTLGDGTQVVTQIVEKDIRD